MKDQSQKMFQIPTPLLIEAARRYPKGTQFTWPLLESMGIGPNVSDGNFTFTENYKHIMSNGGVVYRGNTCKWAKIIRK